MIYSKQHPLIRSTFPGHNCDRYRLISSILRDLGVRSDEFCVCKLIVSTYIWKIGAIHNQIITKPVTSPPKLAYKRAHASANLCFHWLRLTRFSSKLLYSTLGDFSMNGWKGVTWKEGGGEWSQTTLLLLSDYGARLLPFHEDVTPFQPQTATATGMPARGGPTPPCGILHLSYSILMGSGKGLAPGCHFTTRRSDHR